MEETYQHFLEGSRARDKAAGKRRWPVRKVGEKVKRKKGEGKTKTFSPLSLLTFYHQKTKVPDPLSQRLFAIISKEGPDQAHHAS
jgi:hypothetical protein